MMNPETFERIKSECIKLYGSEACPNNAPWIKSKDLLANVGLKSELPLVFIRSSASFGDFDYYYAYDASAEIKEVLNADCEPILGDSDVIESKQQLFGRLITLIDDYIESGMFNPVMSIQKETEIVNAVFDTYKNRWVKCVVIHVEE